MIEFPFTQKWVLFALRCKDCTMVYKTYSHKFAVTVNYGRYPITMKVLKIRKEKFTPRYGKVCTWGHVLKVTHNNQMCNMCQFCIRSNRGLKLSNKTHKSEKKNSHSPWKWNGFSSFANLTFFSRSPPASLALTHRNIVGHFGE